MKEFKNQYVKFISYVLFLISTSIFTSCAENEVDNPIQTSAQGICFGIKEDIGSRSAEPFLNQYFVLQNGNDSLYMKATVTEGIDLGTETMLSRGAVITNASNINRFGVSCYYQNGSKWFDEIATKTTENGQTVWTTEEDRYWPNEGKTLNFYSYYPANATTITAGTDKILTASYTIPSTATQQTDAMIAINEGISDNYYRSVGLSFKHLCTAIRFKFADEIEAVGKVSKIQICGIKGGTISYTYNRHTSSWMATSYTTNTNYELTFDKSSGDVNKDITTDDNLFLLAPQTLPQGAKIIVTFEDKNYEAVISGEWEIGTTITYNINITPDYTLEFTELTETLDAHYIITAIKFKTDVNWMMSIPAEAQSWAYLSKEKTESGTSTNNKSNEITANQKAGMWSYVEKCNKSSISGEVKKEGKVEEITAYLLLRENASTTNRAVHIELKKTGENSGKVREFTQLGYKTYNGIAMERIEDSTSPFGFTITKNNVTYKYSAGGPFENFWPWLISSVVNGWTGFLSFTPKNMTINLTSKVTNIKDSDSGINNTINSQETILDANQNYLIEQGWYTTTEDITIEDTKTATQYCLSKNSYGDFTGNNDDTNATLENSEVVWYLPAINEMLRINSQDNSPAIPYSSSYWSSTAIDDNTNAYSWYYGATQGTSTPRSTNLKIRCARVISQ